MADYGHLQDDGDAVLALLRAVPSLTVFPDEAGGPTVVPAGALPPYVSVHFSSVASLGGTLSHRSTRHATRAYCHCVGADDIAARAVSVLVRNALLDVVPTIDGRVCFPIRNEVGRDPREDESTGEGRVTITDTYRLESLPGVTGS